MDSRIKPPAELPCSIEDEEATIGSVLMGGSEAYHMIDPPLTGQEFYRETHRKLWAILSDLDCIDAQTVQDAAAAAGVDLQLSELMHLFNAVPTWVHVNAYATNVRRMAVKRNLILAAQQNAADAYSANGNVMEVAARSIKRIEAVITPESDQSTLGWERTFTAWNEWQMQRAIDEAEKKPKVDLPWHCLRWVRPLRPSMLAVVAACSGIGKTTFAEILAEHWARKGFQVAFFHYELAHQIMLDRRMARWSGEPMELIETGIRTQAIGQAEEMLYAWAGKINYVHCDGWSMNQVAGKARILARQGRAQIIIVDYLQKAPLREQVHGMTTAQMRGADVETLKHLSEREGTPVWLLSQMNRQASQGSRKTRNTIRDTGEADEKANLVITLDRPILNTDRRFGNRIFKAGSYSPELLVRVDKQTLGATGEVKLLMNPARFAIVEIAEDMEP